MSELEQRFEKWWNEEGWRCCDSQDSRYEGIRAACLIAWMNGADVQKHSTKEQG